MKARLMLFLSPALVAAVISARTLGVGTTLAILMIVLLAAFLTWVLVSPAAAWVYGAAWINHRLHQARRNRFTGSIEVFLGDDWVPREDAVWEEGDE